MRPKISTTQPAQVGKKKKGDDKVNAKGKEVRTLMCIGFMAAILGLILITPLGYVWSALVFGAAGIIDAFLDTRINLMLWGLLCYLITVATFWWGIQSKGLAYILRGIAEHLIAS